MKSYLNNSYLIKNKNSNMPIIKALLKYGQNNFALLIIEYTDKNIVNIRETYWIGKLSPYYNVLKQGYSSAQKGAGYKHTIETKNLLSDIAKKRTHSEFTKASISKSLTGQNNPFYQKSHSLSSKLKMIKANSIQLVYVYNSSKELLFFYPSVLTLAKAINANYESIINYIKTKSLFRGGWYFSNLPLNISDTPLIIDFTSPSAEVLINEIKNNKHVKKALFVYNLNKELINKYDGILIASKDLKISHNIIKKNMHNQNYLIKDLSLVMKN